MSKFYQQFLLPFAILALLVSTWQAVNSTERAKQAETWNNTLATEKAEALNQKESYARATDYWSTNYYRMRGNRDGWKARCEWFERRCK